MTEKFLPRPGDCIIDIRHRSKIPWLIIAVDYCTDGFVTVNYIDPRETMGLIHSGRHKIDGYDQLEYGFEWCKLQ